MRYVLVFASLLALASVASPQGKAGGDDDKVDLNLQGMDLDRVVQLVSDELKVRFMYDDKILKRKVNLISPVEIPRDRLFSVFVTILEMHGFTTVKSGPEGAEVWKIVPFTQPLVNPANKGSLPTVEISRADILPPGEELATLIIPLTNCDARSAFIAIQGMAGDPRMVQAIEPTNVVIVTDTGSNLRRIAEVARLMDRPQPVVGDPSVGIEVCVVEADAAAAMGKADPPALLAGGGRLLCQWSGRLLDGRTADVQANAQSQGKKDAGTIMLRLAVTPYLPGRPIEPAVEGKTPSHAPRPSEGEVALSIELKVIVRSDETSADATDTATLAGKQGEWIVWSTQSAAEKGKVRVLFAKAAR